MKYHLITYGCQMNKNDSERISSFFDKNNLTESEEADADIIVFNACSIRQSSIDRMTAKIKKIKEQSKDKIIILTGCLLKKDIKKLENFCDYILKSEELPSWNLPFLKKEKIDYFEIIPKRRDTAGYISIMKGCNNFCSYCVVPYTKGREFSRPAKDIIEEVKEAVFCGKKEIWLLGQNVNSYNGGISFADLLVEIDKIKGDFWVRFTSSHPKDFSFDIAKAIKNCKKITKYLNLPLQSGDDEILKKMNRPYNAEQYSKLVANIREIVPDIALSTDIIVGFPGETEHHFHNTVKMFNEIDFDMAYIAKYSPRHETKSFAEKETVSEEEKKRREKVLTEILTEKNLIKNRLYLKNIVKVLVMGINKKGYLFGKTEGYKDVIFPGSEKKINSFANIKITKCSKWGLEGKKIIQK